MTLGRMWSTTSAHVRGIVELHPLGRVAEIREREARHPFAEALGALGREETRERRRDQRGRGEQQRAPRSNESCGATISGSCASTNASAAWVRNCRRR